MAVPKPIALERFFRRRLIFRYLNGAIPDGILGAGFLVKQEGAYRATYKHYNGVLVLHGEGTYVDWRQTEHRLFPGCFFQRIPGRPTCVSRKGPLWVECFVDLSRVFTDPLAALGGLDPDRPVLMPGLSLALVERFDRVVRDLEAAPEIELPGILAGIHGLLADIYAMDRRAAPADPRAALLDEACRRLASDLRERISLPALAAKLGMSYERFRKAFRERTGFAPGEWRIRRRIERAQSLLARGETTVAQVADELGYPNPFLFSRQFRRVMGMPPVRWLHSGGAAVPHPGQDARPVHKPR